MTHWRLHDALMFIADRDGLDSVSVVYPRLSVRGRMEGVAHELAHSIDLRSGVLTSSQIYGRVGAMQWRASDNHELRTQRIEVAALRELGMRVDPHRIVSNTDWNLDTPSRARVTAPLTRRERDGVRRFVRAIMSVS